MPSVPVKIINAFTDAGAGGNPAGVVFPADHLTNEMKQQVAAKVGVSETAFVSKSQSADFKLDFFTPNRQIAHCGHATIATFAYLVEQGQVKGPNSSKETIDGNRAIFLQGDMAFMEQLAPKYTALDDPTVQQVLASIGARPADLLPERAPLIVNTGNSFLVIPLKDESALRSLQPDAATITAISDRFDLIGYYPSTLQTQVAGRDAAARMFAPRYAIPEEAATGMAAGPLACFLFDQLNIKKQRLIFEQGRLMPNPSPSEITVDLTLEAGRITRLLAGGRARVMRSFDVEI